MADRGRGSARGAYGSSAFARGGLGGGGGPMRRPPGSGPSSGPQGSSAGDKPRREAILDLSKYVGERIRVKFTGGREVTGVLKGYDQLLNLVLDDVVEELLAPTPTTRQLGLVVLRGPTITVLNPVDGSEEIANPFLATE